MPKFTDRKMFSTQQCFVSYEEDFFFFFLRSSFFVKFGMGLSEFMFDKNVVFIEVHFC